MLQKLDFFGKAVLLNFNGETRSRTRAGGIFTLIFLGFVLWSIYHVGQDIIFRKNPRTVTSQYFTQDPKQMVLSPESFTFAFGVQRPDTFAHYIDESIYTVQVLQKRLTRTLLDNGTAIMTWTDIKLKTERCTQGHFGELGSTLAGMELDQLFCFSREQSDIDNVRIQGVFESPIYEYISIGIQECNENTSAVPCASSDQRKALLEQGWFAVYFTNIAFDSRNYSNPSIHYRDSIFTTFGRSYFKEATMWLNHIEVSSDGGWLVDDKKEREYIQFDKSGELFTLEPNPETFFRFIVRVGKVTTRYERSYIKMQDILADVNGLAGAGLLAAVLFVAPYANIKFYESLINELFDVKTVRKEKTDKNQKQKKKKTRVFFSKRKTSICEEDQTDRAFQLDPLKSNLTLRRASLNAPNFKYVSNKEQDLEYATRERPFKTEEPYTIVVDKKSETGSNKKSRDLEKGGEVLRSSGTNLGPSARVSFESLVTDVKDTRRSQIKGSEQDQKLDTESIKCIIAAPNHSEKKSPSRPSLYGQLQINKPQTVKPNTKILENYENGDQDSVDVVLENFILDTRDQQIVHDRMKVKSLEGIKEIHSYRTERRELSLTERRLCEIDQKDNLGSRERVKPNINRFGSRIINDKIKINMSFLEYLQSFFWRSEALKEKLDILNEGRRRIDERLDIFNVFKKLREVDKLKLLLLENEQLVLFDCLPKPQLLRKESNSKALSSIKSHQLLREAKFINEKRRHDLMIMSYELMKKKSQTTLIDHKLLNIYNEILEASP